MNLKKGLFSSIHRHRILYLKSQHLPLRTICSTNPNNFFNWNMRIKLNENDHCSKLEINQNRTEKKQQTKRTRKQPKKHATTIFFGFNQTNYIVNCSNKNIDARPQFQWPKFRIIIIRRYFARHFRPKFQKSLPTGVRRSLNSTHKTDCNDFHCYGMINFIFLVHAFNSVNVVFRAYKCGKNHNNNFPFCHTMNPEWNGLCNVCIMRTHFVPFNE